MRRIILERKNFLTLIGSISLIIILLASVLLSACAQEAAPAAPAAPAKPAPATPATPTTPATPAKPAPAPAAAEVINWSGQSTTGPGDILYTIVDAWQKKIEEYSDGRLTFELYPPGAIVKSIDVLDALREGVIETANSYGGYWMGFMPEAGIECGLPMVLANAAEATEVFYGLGVIDIMREAYAEHDVYLHSVSAGNEHSFWSTKPVRTMADLQGMKVRAVGETAPMFNMLGAAVTYIPHEESFTALQLGTIDAYATSLAVYDIFKHYEVCPYIMLPPVVPACTDDNLISMRHLNALPDDLRELVISHESTMNWMYWYMLREYHSTLKKSVTDLPGVEIVQMSPELIKEMQAKGAEILAGYAEKNERCAQIVDIYMKFLRGKGYID